MVLSFGRDLFPHASLHKDLRTHNTLCMQIILCFASKGYHNIQTGWGGGAGEATSHTSS